MSDELEAARLEVVAAAKHWFANVNKFGGTTHGAYDRLMLAVRNLNEAEGPQPRYDVRGGVVAQGIFDHKENRFPSLVEVAGLLNAAADTEGR